MSAPRRVDAWLIAAALVVVALYAALPFLKPGGEGWARGWNLIAYLLYASPSALIAAAIAGWRSGRQPPHGGTLARCVVVAGVVFPVICLVVIRAKA